MKKQIFILVFLVVAVFASVSKSYGQAIAPMAGGAVTAPRTLTLTDSPGTPIAGKPYTYSATINPATGNAYWYATKSTTFMTAGVRSATVIAASATTVVPDATTGNYATVAPTAAGTGATSTTITWSADVLSGVNSTTSPLFMVVESNGTTCTTSNNVKVMQIVPKNAFTIDLTNIDHATKLPKAYDVKDSTCYSAIASSKWVSGTGMTTDYGSDSLYYELIAANFTGSFKPTFKLDGLKTGQTADVSYDFAVNGSYSTVLQANVSGASVTLTATPTISTALGNTNSGVAIYIKVKIKHNGYEGLSSDPITLAVDATDSATTPNDDVKPDGTVKTAYSELAVQILKPRPTVTAGTGVTFLN